MAVQFISSQSFTNDTNIGAHALTIPVDCELVVVFTAGIDATSGETGVTYMNFDGNGYDFTLIGTSPYDTGYPRAEAHYYVSPPTGAQTLNTQWVNSPTSGRVLEVVYLKGVDTTDPIGSIEKIPDTDGAGPSSITTSLTGVDAGDMALGVVCNYQTVPDMDPAGTGQTALTETAYRNAGAGFGYEVGDGALQFDSLNEVQYVAFAVNGTGGDTTPPVAQIMMAMNQFSGGL